MRARRAAHALQFHNRPKGPEAWRLYRLYVRRQRLMVRAFRKSFELKKLRHQGVAPEGVLAFVTLRNERKRLPYFLEHHRALGVTQFFIVDNDSTDGSRDYLLDQRDVSLWSTKASYRKARFGMDWLTYLLTRYGSGRWCLTLDADEALIVPHHGGGRLKDLTAWLDQKGQRSFSAMMVDLYPEGRLSANTYTEGQAFTEALPYYDAHNYTWERQPRFGNISIRGGVRRRVFFPDAPELSPHLHKTPLIKWHWRYVYASSTHNALPSRLNRGFDARLGQPTGVLAHAKFLDELLSKSADPHLRREHFTSPQNYDAYYAAIMSDPILKTKHSKRFTSWKDLEKDGLMTRGEWLPQGAD